MKIFDFLYCNSKSVKPILVSRDQYSPLSEGWRKFKEFLTGWLKKIHINHKSHTSLNPFCHCEERSDEAIYLTRIFYNELNEIASPTVRNDRQTVFVMS